MSTSSDSSNGDDPLVNMAAIDFTRALSVAGTGLVAGYVAPKIVGDKPLKSALTLGFASVINDAFRVDTYIPSDEINSTAQMTTAIADGAVYSAIEAVRLKEARRLKRVLANLLYGAVTSGVSAKFIEPRVIQSMGRSQMRRGRAPNRMTMRNNVAPGTRAPGFAPSY